MGEYKFMKTKFHEFFMLDGDAYKSVWEAALVVLDANILLNMYRYSDPTKAEFFAVLKELEDRLWLPHRAVEEFLSNRLDVLDSQDKKYEKSLEDIRLIKKELEQTRHHPFVSEGVMRKAVEAFDVLSEELQLNKNKYASRIYNDDVKDALGNLFVGKVGQLFDESVLREIIAEGEARYANKIPPGYKDIKKKTDSDYLPDMCRPYGDLILWKQILQKSIEESKHVIYVTDDRKEDWWYEHKGKTIGPRPELIREFKQAAGMDMVMFSPEKFLEEAKTFLNRDISPEAVKEVGDVSKEEEEARVLSSNSTEDLLRSQSKLAVDYSRLNSVAMALQSLQKEQSIVDFAIEELNEKIAAVRDSVSANAPFAERLRDRVKNADIVKKLKSSGEAYQVRSEELSGLVSELLFEKKSIELEIQVAQSYGIEYR